MRLHAFLNAWAESDKQSITAGVDDHVEKLCDAVFSSTFGPRFQPQSYSHNPDSSAQRTSQGDYVILPDSIVFAVVNEVQLWDTLSNPKFSAFREHAMIRGGLHYRKYRPRIQTTRTVLYGDQIHWCAFYSFLHGARTPIVRMAPRLESSTLVARHSLWIKSFIQICFYTFVTQPEIYSIEFNSTLTESLVRIADACGYRGSTDLYTNIETVWTKKYVVSTWVQ